MLTPQTYPVSTVAFQVAVPSARGQQPVVAFLFQNQTPSALTVLGASVNIAMPAFSSTLVKIPATDVPAPFTVTPMGNGLGQTLIVNIYQEGDDLPDTTASSPPINVFVLEVGGQSFNFYGALNAGVNTPLLGIPQLGVLTYALKRLVIGGHGTSVMSCSVFDPAVGTSGLDGSGFPLKPYGSATFEQTGGVQNDNMGGQLVNTAINILNTAGVAFNVFFSVDIIPFQAV